MAKRIIKLVSTTDTWRHDTEKGYVILGNPDGSRPTLDAACEMLMEALAEIVSQALEA